MNGVMQDFRRTELQPIVKEDFIRELTALGRTRKQALHFYFKLMADEIWVNDQYQVNIDRQPAHGFGENVEVIELSIKRLDKEPIMDWRDLQVIKNKLVGPNYEALQLFPSESRLVDTSNQYYLYVLKRMGEVEAPMIPCGFTERMVKRADWKDRGQSKQRPLPDEQNA